MALGISRLQPQVQPQVQEILSAQIVTPTTTLDILTEQIQAVTPIQDVAQIQAQAQIQEQLQQQVQVQILAQGPIGGTRIRLEPKVGEAVRPLLKLIPPSLKEGFEEIESELSLRKKGFDVFVREGEKRGDEFKKIASNLPRNKALRLGRDVVDNFVEASFLIKPLKRTSEIKDDLNEPDLSKFRSPRGKTKLPKGTLVEFRKNRIDTEGEKTGLNFFRMLEQRKSQLGLAEEQEIPLRREPKLPELTEIQQKVVDVVSKRGDAITGSLAQRTLLQQRFTRQFKDIDVVSKTPRATAIAIKKRLGEKVEIKKVEITTAKGRFSIFRIIDKETGKVIADVDPEEFAEEGFVKQFPTVQVGGLTFVSPRARLAAKVAQLRRGKIKEGKVTRDIEKLTKKKFQRPLLVRELIGLRNQKKKQVLKNLIISSKQQATLLKENKQQQISFIKSNIKAKKQKKINLIAKKSKIKFL